MDKKIERLETRKSITVQMQMYFKTRMFQLVFILTLLLTKVFFEKRVVLV